METITCWRWSCAREPFGSPTMTLSTMLRNRPCSTTPTVMRVFGQLLRVIDALQVQVHYEVVLVGAHFLCRRRQDRSTGL